MSLPANIYHRIAESVTKELDIEISDANVHEILEAETIGWSDSVVAAVQMDSLPYYKELHRIPPFVNRRLRPGPLHNKPTTGVEQ
jgi:hypothetical protein